MHHSLELFLREQRVHPGAVREVELDEAEPRVLAQDREPRFLQRRVVVVVEVVETDHLVAAIEEPAGDVKADEAGRAGDEDLHGHSLASASSLSKTYLMS